MALLITLYLFLTGWELGLPGLHYDEAREAGVNAMELLTHAPVTAFRGAAISLFGLRLPLMVQDYIGALNVYLALPFLALTGIGVPNLRALSLLTGAIALLLLERTVSEWSRGGGSTYGGASAPVTPAGLISVALVALSPSFVYWSRQGIFVTNLTQPLTLLCLWQGLRWLHSGRAGALYWSAAAAGLALYAKLLALWVVAPFLALLAAGWLWRRRRAGPAAVPRLTIPALLGGAALCLAGLAPLILFNLQTGGTLTTLGGSLSHSYYGVNNAAVLHNLPLRLQQLVQSLQGSQFWYLGGIYGNWSAPGLAALIVALGLWQRPQRVGPPLLLLGLAVATSLFTVSDLFITHYALLQPLVVGLVALALADGVEPVARRLTGMRSWLPILLLVLLWIGQDLSATLAYQRALRTSGGLGDHSDGIYHLAYHLRYNGMGAPLALDWGLDAPVRFLSEGTVTPIEIFGYSRLEQPDDQFAARLVPYLEQTENVYLLRAPAQTVFHGRREQFMAQAQALGLLPQLMAQFQQRDGTPLYEIWQLTSAPLSETTSAQSPTAPNH